MLDLDKSANQSTQVAFLLIETMAEIGEPVALGELARRTGMPKPRTYRFLRTLQALGYVAQGPEDDRYRLTLKIFHIGQAVADRTQLLTEARPLMVQLRDRTGMTTTLSLVEAEGMRVLDIVRAASPVEIVTRPGAVLQFHCSAQGKVALAFGPPELWARVQAGGLHAWTAKTKTDPGHLAALIDEVRARGWAEAPEEVIAGVNALSAPIFDARRALAATVTIAGPVDAIGRPPDPALVAAVRQAARGISGNLGYTEPDS